MIHALLPEQVIRRTSVAMASTMGTARGRTQASWRPLPASSVFSPEEVTVSCEVMMVAVGLKATRKRMCSPLEMPPCTPPERLLVVRTLPSTMRKGSLCSRPVSSVPAKPEPISKPLVAGMESMALARSASSLSKIGSPRPGGQLRMTHSITPPTELPSARMALMRSIIGFDHRRIAGADDVGLDVRGGDGFRIDAGVEFLDGFHPGEHFDAGMQGVEHLPGDGGGGDAADGFAGGGAAAAGRGADAVFGVVGVIGVAGPVFHGHFIVGAGALVGVSDDDGDGRAERQPVVQAGEDFGGVRLLARGDDVRLAGAAAVEFALDVFQRDRDARRAAIDDDADAAAVRLAEGVDAENLAESG